MTGPAHEKDTEQSQVPVCAGMTGFDGNIDQLISGIGITHAMKLLTGMPDFESLSSSSNITTI